MALIPGWDFCNHRCGKMATYYNPEGHVSESFTMEPVSKGQPIYLHYGNRPNSKLFVFSGFVADDNPYDTFEFDLALAPDDPLLKIKRLLLGKLQLNPPLSLPITDNLTQAFRVAVLSKDEASLALKDTSVLSKPINPRNEKEAWELAIQTFSQLLQPHGEEEKAGGDPQAMVAIRVKFLEKRLLKQAIQYAQDHLPINVPSGS